MADGPPKARNFKHKLVNNIFIYLRWRISDTRLSIEKKNKTSAIFRHTEIERSVYEQATKQVDNAQPRFAFGNLRFSCDEYREGRYIRRRQTS